jgi:hypothetical protein
MFEQCEFLVGKLDRLISSAGRVFQAIELEIARTQLEASFPFAAEQCPAASPKLMEAEGLDHEVVCAEIQATNTGVDLLTGGQDQNREVKVQCTDLLQHLFTILHWHIQIENGQVRQILTEGFNGSASIKCQSNTMSISLKPAA